MKKFPDSNITCGEIASIPAIDGMATCNELSNMADYCGCPASGEKCSMCPNGGDPSYPNRTFLTTGENCQYVLDLLYASPRSDCGLYVPDMMIDFPSYCGCPGSEAPKTCSLCPADTQLAYPDKEIMYAPGSTCSDFVTYAEHVTGDELCDFMHEVIAVECCKGAGLNLTAASDDCSFCQGGTSVAHPDRELMGLNMTCAKLASRQSESCDGKFETALDPLLDTTIYCGCPLTVDTGVCSFCPAGQALLNPDLPITTADEVNGATCGDYAAIAGATLDDTFCLAVQSVAEMNGCCGTVGANYTLDSQDVCHLCRNGDPIRYGDRQFLGTEIKCDEYFAEMMTTPSGPVCDAIFSDFEDTFDPQVYCGCPNAEPKGSCKLCPNSSSVVDPSIFISDILTTCGQLEDIASATSNEEFCQSIERVGEYYCCFSPEGPNVRRLGSPEHEFTSSVSETAKRPYHFSAIKAVDTVEKAITHMVGHELVKP